MANSNDVLKEIKLLAVKLYGDNGFEGDITDIKNHLEKLNGHLDDHSKRITVAEIQLAERTSNNPGSNRGKIFWSGLIAGIGAVVAIGILEVGQTVGWW